MKSLSESEMKDVDRIQLEGEKHKTLALRVDNGESLEVAGHTIRPSGSRAIDVEHPDGSVVRMPGSRPDSIFRAMKYIKGRVK